MTPLQGIPVDPYRERPVNVEKGNEDQALELAYECRKSLKFFCKTFFPDLFYIPFSPYIHDAIFDFLDNNPSPKKVIKAPRGSGKSTLVNFAYPLQKLVYRRTNFMLQASATMPLAIEDSRAVKEELVANDDLIEVFGPFKPTEQATDFSKEQWQTEMLPPGEHSNGHPGTLVRPISWKHAIRGRKYHTRGYGFIRPDLAIVDDLEKTEEAQSETQREKVLNWFISDLRNVFQRSETKGPYEFDWEWIVIGTLLHDDAIIQRLCDDEDWASLELSIWDAKKQVSLWPEFFSTETILKDKAEYTKHGKSDLWYLEYMGQAIDPENVEFKDNYFETFEERELEGLRLETIALMDIAKTKETYSAETVIAVLSFCPDNSTFYVRDMIYGKMDPILLTMDEHGNPQWTDTIEALFEMTGRFDSWITPKIAYDRTGLGLFAEWPLENYNRSENLNYHLYGINLTGDKDDRIRALAPLHRTGHFKYNPRIMEPIKLQFMRGKASKKKDRADALSLLIPLMGQEFKFFRPTKAALRVDFKARMKHIREHIYSRMPPMKPQRIPF